MKLIFLSLISLIVPFVNCHVEMTNPPPRRSKFSSYYVSSGLVDYNLMAPINSGYTFPCKGYQSGPSTKRITGNTVAITLQGSAIHGGGHCQFGISTDDQTFLVLKTVIRNCLLTGMSYSFDVPNLPSTKLTVFWTWVNAIGNREYYMDCADIEIGTGNQVSVVNGKSLLVLNLPGYTTLPEFPNPGMYDGRELFDSRRDISISVSSKNTGTSPAPPSNPQPVLPPTPPSNPEPVLPPAPPNNPQPVLPPAPPNNPEPVLPPAPPSVPIESEELQSSDNNCISGHMKCGINNGFDTCDHNKYIWRPCAPGTKCKEFNNSIICTYK